MEILLNWFNLIVRLAKAQADDMENMSLAEAFKYSFGNKK